MVLSISSWLLQEWVIWEETWENTRTRKPVFFYNLISEVTTHHSSCMLFIKSKLLLLLLLSHFSCVRLCATPETAAHQAPLSLGFSRQEHWSALPFPSPRHESEKWKWGRSAVSDSWRPGSSFHGIFQARVLEWVVIAFSQEQATDTQSPTNP